MARSAPLLELLPTQPAECIEGGGATEGGAGATPLDHLDRALRLVLKGQAEQLERLVVGLELVADALGQVLGRLGVGPAAAGNPSEGTQ